VSLKLEVEGEAEKMEKLFKRLKMSSHVDSVSWVDKMSEHELDTVDLAVSRLEEKRDLGSVTPGEVADTAGLPRDKTVTALEELGRLDDLWST